MSKDPELRAHQEWLGYLQPAGLVVSAPALASAGAHVNRNIVPDHRRFLDHVQEVSLDGTLSTAIADLPAFLRSVLGWRAADVLGAPGADPLPDALEVTLPEYNETLRPTYAVRDADGAARSWLLLIQVLPLGTDMDETVRHDDDRRWRASTQARFDRLLREEAYVPIGLLCNGTSLRLVCAQHNPSNELERRFLHGAACHGCLLLSETSCEMHNDLLDRALVAPTVEDRGAEFFTESS